VHARRRPWKRRRLWTRRLEAHLGRGVECGDSRPWNTGDRLPSVATSTDTAGIRREPTSGGRGRSSRGVTVCGSSRPPTRQEGRTATATKPARGQ